MTEFENRKAQNKIWADNYRDQRLKDWFYPQIDTDVKATDLISLVNEQSRLKEDYGDRVLLELLQNADDAANSVDDKYEKSVRFILDGKSLIILNQGKTFNETTLKNLCISNVSSKSSDDVQTTGSKGIGFRGILNWSKEVKIYSGDFAIHFSHQECIKAFEKYQNTPVYKQALSLKENWAENYPFLAIPFNTEYPKEWENGKYKYKYIYYDTCIEIILQDDKIDNYRNEFHHFIKNEIFSMLFLLRISKISFLDKTEGIEKEIYIKKDKENDINGMHHLIATITSENEDKKYHLFYDDTETIAVPYNWERKNYKLFATFPINDQQCPFPVIMNSRIFDLTSNRNSLTKTDNNEKIIKKLGKMLVEKIAPYFAKPEFGTQAIEMVAYENIIGTKFSGDIEFLEESISEQNIIPTANCDYKNLNNNLNIIRYEDCPDFIIKYEDSPFITNDVYGKICFSDSLKRKISVLDEPQKLYEFINEQSTKWTLQQRMRVLLFWLKTFPNGDILPNLIKNKKDVFISFCSKEHIIPFFYSGAKIDFIPDWLEIDIIKEEEQKELFRQFEQSIENQNMKDPMDRLISQKYSKFFNYMDKAGLGKKINSQVKGIFSRSVDLLKFIYENYKKETNISSDNDVEWHIPDSNNQVTVADSVYFGTEYGDDIGVKICAAAGLTPIPSPDVFGIRNDEIVDFKHTIKEFFKIRDNILPIKSKINDSSYKEKVKEEMQRLLKISGYTLYEILSVEGVTIPELSSILKNADMNLILDWLYRDVIPILSPTDNIRCEFSRSYKYGDARFVEMQNHVAFELLHTEWIKKEKKTISPEYCLIPSKTYPESLVPFVPEYTERKQLWDKLNIKQYIYQLPGDAFYKIMLELPKIDSVGQISKKIYREIANAQLDDLKHLRDSDCEEKDAFFKSGFLWARNRTKTGYFPVSEKVYFSNKKNINLPNKPIMETPLRSGSIEKFENIFDVLEFKEEIVADYNACRMHPDNSKLDKELNDFKPFLRALDATDELNKAIPNIIISLCKDIKVLDNQDNIEIQLNDYDIVVAKNNKFCVFLNETAQLDNKKIAGKIGEICDTISKSKDIADTITVLYLLESYQNRIEYLTENGYDLNLLSEYKGIEQHFVETIKEICPNVDIKQLLQKYPINFRDFGSRDSIQSLRNIFTELETNVDAFKEHNFNDINFTDDNKRLLTNYINKNTLRYKEYLYNKLFDAKIDEKEKFEDEFYKFSQCAQDINIPNTHDFKPDIVQPIPEYDRTHKFSEKLLADNYKKLQNELNLKNPDEQLKELINDDKNKSLLWFGQIDELCKRYNQKHIKDSEFRESSTNVPMPLKIHLHKRNTDEQSLQSLSQKTPKKTHRKSQFNSKINALKDWHGFDAEKKVYDTLVEKYGQDNVQWISGNASNAGIIIGSGYDSAGYDLKYTDESGDLQYAEVKSATSEGKSVYSFFITGNEESFLQKNISNYHLFLVINNEDVEQIEGVDLLHYCNEAKPEQKKCYITIANK